MCGNGARCMARCAFENRIVKKPDMTFETLAGDVHAEVKGCTTLLDLPPVRLEKAVIDRQAVVGDYAFNYTFLTVGVPHAVLFLAARDKNDDEYRRMGRALRYATELFPEGANINFAFPRASENELEVLTYERGVEDLTLSCGTGSTASAIAARLTGRMAEKNVHVYNPGGLNRVRLSFESDMVVLPALEGAVVYVADIDIYEDALG